MKLIILAILAIVVLWNGFASLLGITNVLGDGPFSIIASLLFTMLVLGFLLGTRKIMQIRRSRGGFMIGLLVLFWIVAALYGFYTSWIGQRALLIPDEGSIPQFIILFGLTLLSVSSPILLSILWPWALGQSGNQTKMPQQTPRRPVERSS